MRAGRLGEGCRDSHKLQGTSNPGRRLWVHSTGPAGGEVREGVVVGSGVCSPARAGRRHAASTARHWAAAALLGLGPAALTTPK